ncbi:TraR/DksA family transcriptional regulator [Aliishimia ponticola]|uniref:TraR/DksA family transcriptional regulator n=1 Tax=Aliishimia ponticola TaxID=2499833 RepID=A0A4S4NGI1_9RHOB|nr:TraR/DksA C4-type zinc finger protein [Aliishimia ponticola]THH35180.1 TraR/DksA family transcriptional regulator [Aliishimia ponticola]
MTTPRDTLLKLRQEILAELDHIEQDLDAPKPKDWDDAASERQGDEVLQALGEHDLEELRGIDAALKRVDEGEYGFCVKCGSEISPERLELLPATPFCKTCAAQI